MSPNQFQILVIMSQDALKALSATELMQRGISGTASGVGVSMKYLVRSGHLIIKKENRLRRSTKYTITQQGLDLVKNSGVQ
jgi:predicted transcriptional regulator